MLVGFLVRSRCSRIYPALSISMRAIFTSLKDLTNHISGRKRIFCRASSPHKHLTLRHMALAIELVGHLRLRASRDSSANSPRPPLRSASPRFHRYLLCIYLRAAAGPSFLPSLTTPRTGSHPARERMPDPYFPRFREADILIWHEEANLLTRWQSYPL